MKIINAEKLGRQIYLSIYGLLGIVIIIFTLAILIFQLQYNENTKKYLLISDYHLASSEAAFKLGSELDSIKLWFLKHDVVLQKEVPLLSRILTQPLNNMVLSERDKIDKFKFEIKRLVEKISALQREYADPEFNVVNGLLRKAHRSVQLGLGNLQIEKYYSYKKVNYILSPFVAVVKQLQRLHQYEYQSKSQLLKRYQYKVRIQLVTLVLLLAAVGVYGVTKILRNVRHALRVLAATQKELKENEQNFSALSSNMLDGLLVSSKGKHVFANDSIVKMLGYEKVEDIIGTTIMDVVHPDEVDKILQKHDLRMQGKIVKSQYETRFITKTGVPISVELNASSTIWKGVSCGMITIRDVTARKKAEAALIEAFELNEKIIYESPIGLAIYNSSGDCVVANKSFASMIGATVDQMLSQNYNEIPSWKETRTLELAKKSIQLQENIRYESRIITSFGMHGYFDCLFVPFKLHNEQQLLLMIDDIGERKKSERALKESEVLLEKAQEMANVGSWKLDPLTNIISGSEQFFSIFELSPEGTRLDDFIRVVHPEDREFVSGTFRKGVNYGEGWEIDYRIVTHNGNNKWVHGIGEAVKDEDGKVIQLIAVVQDVSIKKKNEVELNNYRNQLENLVGERTRKLRDAQDELVRKERLATLGQLTATVSHELRNPLGAMRPSLYVIDKKSDRDDERLQSAIERVDRNIERCDRIIDELLDFTRISVLDRRLTQIDDWLESVIEEQDIPEHIQIKKDFSLYDTEIAIDRSRLRRAVINVVENACHAMVLDKDQLNGSKEFLLEMKTSSIEDGIKISIADTGEGIPDDVLVKIYEPLFSTKGFGVGLGMPTVKQIMEQHDGGVEIETEKGKGTSVTLWLGNGQLE